MVTKELMTLIQAKDEALLESISIDGLHASIACGYVSLFDFLPSSSRYLVFYD
jgi:hypothetical protein